MSTNSVFMEQKADAEWLITCMWPQEYVGGRDSVWAQVCVILKPVHFLLIMLSLLLEDTFDVFLFSRSDLQTTGAFWALHYSLMWKLFLKNGGELGDRSNQKRKKWEKRAIVNTPQHRQMEHIGSQPLLSFYVIIFGGLIFDQILYPFFSYVLKHWL